MVDAASPLPVYVHDVSLSSAVTVTQMFLAPNPGFT